MRMCRNPAPCSAQDNCRQRWMVNRTIYRHGRRVMYPTTYIILRSVAKSVGVSEDKMRGHPLGDSADAKLV